MRLTLDDEQRPRITQTFASLSRKFEHDIIRNQPL
jgi:hypothetical protein